jgi:cobalt-zinc-cadmium efflux system membrane fusion protein
MSRNAVIIALVAALAGAAVGAGAVFTDGFRRAPGAPTATASAGNPAARPEHAKEGGEHKEKPGEVHLKPGQVEIAGIKAVAVAPGSIAVELMVPGEITANLDRVAQIVPRVPGVAREVRARLGDRVRAGDTLALIDSRELAEATSNYLTARERAALARTKAEREERLWRQRISAEQDYLEAKQKFAEERIAERAADQKLRALGLSTAEIGAIGSGSYRAMTQFSVTAPFDGTVIEKNVTPGQLVETQTALFKIANLETVWVIGNIYEKDMTRVKVGQQASVTVQSHPDRRFAGKVAWVSDVVEEQTRTLRIRVEVDNREGLLRPGTFARIALQVASKDGVIAIAPAAIQRQGGEMVVFVDEGEGRYTRREVTLGIRTPEQVEIAWGLDPGERVVVEGSFLLKSELEKAGFEAGHAH